MNPLPSFIVTIHFPNSSSTEMRADGYNSAYHAAQWAASCLGDGRVHRDVSQPGQAYCGANNLYVVRSAG